MQRTWIVIAAAALGVWPVGLPGQRTPPPGTPPPAPPAPPAPTARAPRVWTYSTTEHRARLGVVVRTDASPETDKIGAKIEGVTAGRPTKRASRSATASPASTGRRWPACARRTRTSPDRG